MPDQHNKLVGNTLKYPYVVGINTESGNFGTGILISARFVLTCSHVLNDSGSAEVVSSEGTTSGRVQKIDDSLDLALLELTRPISGPKAKFSDSRLRPDATVLVAGVQVNPGQPDQFSVAEIELKLRNKNVSDRKVLDFQLEGGARPGYSGGPVVVVKGGALLCVGVMRLGGSGAATSNAIGLASIRGFVADYIPDMQEDKLGPHSRRRLISTAFLFGAVVIGAITGWHYLESHSLRLPGGTAIVTTQAPEKIVLRQPASVKKPSSLPQGPAARPNLKPKDYAPLTLTRSTAPAEMPLAQTPQKSSVSDYVGQPQTHGGDDQGNPDVKVWVNTVSSVYHCPGTRWYGNTKHGEYMTQAEAHRKGNRPANGKLCE